MPRILYISKTDEENAGLQRRLRRPAGSGSARTWPPLSPPSGTRTKKVIGIIDVLHKRAYEMQGDKRVEIEVPEDKLPVLDELYDALKESVAETSEEFMDKYFSGEDFTYAEMLQGLRQGVRDPSLFPVVCGSAVQGLGTLMLLDTVVDLIPNPWRAPLSWWRTPTASWRSMFSPTAPIPCAFVFKTTSDQYGKYSYVKVMSGNLTPDMTLVNARTGENVKLGRLYIMKGKKAEEVKGAGLRRHRPSPRWRHSRPADTICDARKVVKFPALPFPEPCYSVAIAPQDPRPGGQDRRRPHPV